MKSFLLTILRFTVRHCNWSHRFALKGLSHACKQHLTKYSTKCCQEYYYRIDRQKYICTDDTGLLLPCFGRELEINAHGAECGEVWQTQVFGFRKTKFCVCQKLYASNCIDKCQDQCPLNHIRTHSLEGSCHFHFSPTHFSHPVVY